MDILYDATDEEVLLALTVCQIEGTDQEIRACWKDVFVDRRGDDSVDSGVNEDGGDVTAARNDSIEGSLTLTYATAAPLDCWRVPWTDTGISIACFYEVRAQDSWQTNISPAYMHCQGWNATLSPDGGTTSYDLPGVEGALEITVVANPGGQVLPDHDPQDMIPDVGPPPDTDRHVPFECILSSDPEGYQYSTEFGFFRPANVDSRLALVRCDRPLSDGAATAGACAPSSDIATALQAPWVEATKEDIGAN